MERNSSEINEYKWQGISSFITVRELRISLLFAEARLEARPMKKQQKTAQKRALLSEHFVPIMEMVMVMEIDQ